MTFHPEQYVKDEWEVMVKDAIDKLQESRATLQDRVIIDIDAYIKALVAQTKGAE